MLKDLIHKNRSYRRFYQEESISIELLTGLVDIARLCPSAANRQPLKFILSADKKRNDLIFPCLAWAGYLKDWAGPQEGEKPSAYVIILHDKNIFASPNVDHGIAAQSIMLAAVESGYGGCIIASIQKKELAESLEIPAHLEILLVLALGKPKEEVIIDPIGENGNIEYWRDAQGRHHVPKRSLNDIVL